MSNLFESTPYICFYPKVANKIGVNETLILSRLHFLIESNQYKGNEECHFDNNWWTVVPMTEWRRLFPYLKYKETEKILADMEEKGMIYVYQAKKGKVKFYTINYQFIEKTQLSIEDDQNHYSPNKTIRCKDTGEVCTADKYFETEHWQNLRSRVYSFHNGICQMCNRLVKFEDCNIHHKTYKFLGNEGVRQLMLLCENCHQEIHGQRGRKVHTYHVEKISDTEKSNLNEATEKQIKYATNIAEVLGIDLPGENTKVAYSEFISMNVDDFNRAIEERRR